MTIALRVLCVEDSEDDTWLIVRQLQRGGLNPDTASAELNGHDKLPRIQRGREDDRVRRLIAPLKLAQRFETGAPRHAQVDQHEVGLR